MKTILKKTLMVLLVTLSTAFTGMIANEKVYADSGLMQKGPIKILCGYPGCPGHLPGEPYCVPPIPSKLYFNSYNDDIDTRKDIDKVKGYFESANYNVVNKVNTSFEDMNSYENEYNLMNRKYYFISSHGSESGYVYFSPNSYYKANSFPYMGNVEIALFAICYGGKEGNAADVVAHHKGVEYGIGWPGLTYVLSSRTFTNRFWKLIIKDNLDIEEAISKSKKHTQRTYFYNFGIWGDNTIMDPRIYSENSNLNTRSSNNYIENILDKEMIFEDDNHFIHFKKYGDVYTNNFKIVDKNNIIIKDYNELIHNKSEKYLLANTNDLAYNIINNNFLNTYIMKKFPNNYLYELILEQNYLLTNTKGEFVKIKRMQIKINDNILDEIFYDETNMKIIDEDEMQNYFDYSNFLEELK